MRSPLVVLLALTAVLLGAAIASGVANDDDPRIVFLARGDDPADALAVAPLAGRLGVPVLTTPADRLDPSAEAALRQQRPDVVFVAGGPTAIEEGVLDAVRVSLGLDPDQVVRVAGADRYATAAAVADLFSSLSLDPAPAGAHVVRVLDTDVANDTTSHIAIPTMTIDARPGQTWVLRSTVSYAAGEDEDIVLGFRVPEGATVNVTGLGLAPFADQAIGVGRFASDDEDTSTLTEINAFGGLGPDADLAADMTATVVMGDASGPIEMVLRQDQAGPMPATLLEGTFLVADRL